MKKIIICLLLVSIVFSTLSFCTFADEDQNTNAVQTVKASDGSTITYFDDGSFLTVSPVREIGSSVATYATDKTASGSKDVTFTDANGNLDWTYTLTATFSYVYGVSSTCTSASYTKEIYDNDWSFSDGSATKSGNVATGKGKFVCKVLFITFKTYNIDISITCDIYGNLS